MKIRESETLFLVICISLVVLAAYVFIQKPFQRSAQNPQTQNEVAQPINNASELNETLSELDNTDLNQFDQGIQQNTADTATF